ncbi:MAG: HDIG domain-containing protein [Spirochaetales bacterium]|jgi:putative nucleotidyltransferase with HDIG domain|nr:HDIG domain-containing protein [Spirochaetales bacterium]
MKSKAINALLPRLRSITVFRALVLFSAFLIIVVSLILTEFFKADRYKELLLALTAGQPSPVDIFLSRDLVYLDSVETERQRRVSEMRMLPIFVFNSAVVEKVKKTIEGLRQYLSRRRNGRNSGAPPLADRLYAELFQMNEIEYVAEVFREDELAARLSGYADDMLSEGYCSISGNFSERYPKGFLEIFFNNGASPRIVDIDDILTRENFRNVFFRKAYADKLNPAQAQALFIAAYAIFEENVFFDEKATQERLLKIREDVRPVFKTLPGETMLVTKGQIITGADMEKIRLFAYSLSTHSARGILGPLTYLLLLGVIAIILMRPPMVEKTLTDKQFLFLTCIHTLYLVSSVIMYRFIALPDNFPLAVVLPTALVTMLISVIISYRAGVLNTAVLSLGQILFPSVSPEAIAFVFFSGIIGTRAVRKADKRLDLLNAGMILALEQGLAAIILSFLADFSGYIFFGVVVAAALSGLVWGILNLTVLPLVEDFMHAATKFRLMELSDLDTPTLKRMLNLAPGTYNHSISVGNLAETACREIGANALLARVGAYYHDIGKIDQAEYFIENQSGFNKHDYIKSGLSGVIIRSHVKIGVEQAAKLGLPDEVKDIIGQHHGDGVIRYFYQKALGSKERGATEEDFLYTGTPPQSKEAAVVMLADSVEAASRLFKKPTFITIDKAVMAIFREKIDSGQLDEAPISLSDLDKTRKCFVKVLSGQFHSRIEYPAAQEQQ